MLLSDILAPDQIQRTSRLFNVEAETVCISQHSRTDSAVGVAETEILLVDRAFPLQSSEPSMRNINPDHLSSAMAWPIPLIPIRCNLKKAPEVLRLRSQIFRSLPASTLTAVEHGNAEEQSARDDDNTNKNAPAPGTALPSDAPRAAPGFAAEGPVVVLGIHLCGQLSIKYDVLRAPCLPVSVSTGYTS